MRRRSWWRRRTSTTKKLRRLPSSIRREKRAALGLHVTLTGPLRPLSANFAPLRHGHFLSLNAMLRLATARRLQPEPLASEIAAQLQKFIDVFGRPPDFLDGHQHIQLFPQVRDAFLKVVAERAPSAWVRQCGRARRGRRLRDHKALVLDILSLGFRRKAKKARDCGQSGLCRLLRLQVAGELRQAVSALSVRPAGWRPDHVSPGCRRYRAKRPGFADNPARARICLLWFRCFFAGPCRA